MCQCDVLLVVEMIQELVGETICFAEEEKKIEINRKILLLL